MKNFFEIGCIFISIFRCYHRNFFLLFILPTIAFGTHAQVFKCKDDSGKISYGGTPCPASQQGGAVYLTDNVLETRNQREQEYFKRSLSSNSQYNNPSSHQENIPNNTTHQNNGRFNISYDCEKAMRNAGVQSTLKPKTEAQKDLEQAKVARICGFDPSPERTRKKEERRLEREQEKEETQRKSTIVGNDGTLYIEVPGGAISTINGKFCPRISDSIYSCN